MAPPPTIPNIPAKAIDLDELTSRLKVLEEEADKRHSRWGWTVAWKGFFDGVYDILALMGIPGSIAAILILPVIFTGVGAFFGVCNAINVYRKEKEDYDKEKKKFKKIDENIDKLRKIKAVSNVPNERPVDLNLDNLANLDLTNPSISYQLIYSQYHEHIEKTVIDESEKQRKLRELNDTYNQFFEELRTLPEESAEPPKSWWKSMGNGIDEADNSSRQGRNAFNTATLLVTGFYFFLENVGNFLTPEPILFGIMTTIVSLILVPRLVYKFLLLKPRENAQKEINKHANDIDLVLERSLDEKNIHSLENSLRKVTGLASLPPAIDTTSELSSSSIGTPRSGISSEEMSSSTHSSFKGSATDSTDSDIDSLLSQATIKDDLLDDPQWKDPSKSLPVFERNEDGLVIAYISGFINGALHPVAWVLIVLLGISFFMTPPSGGIALGLLIGLGVGCITGAIFARRCVDKEHKEQDDEIDNWKKWSAARNEAFTFVQKTMPKPGQGASPLNKLNKTYYDAKEKLHGNTEALAKLEEKYTQFKSLHEAAIDTQRNATNVLSESLSPTTSKKELTSTTALSQKLGDKISEGVTFGADLLRKTRDHFSLMESTIIVLMSIAAMSFFVFGWPALVVAGVACALTIGLCIYKEIVIDKPRKNQRENYEKATEAHIEATRTCKTQRNGAEAKKILLERLFSAEADTLVKENTPESVTSPVLFQAPEKVSAGDEKISNPVKISPSSKPPEGVFVDPDELLKLDQPPRKVKRSESDPTGNWVEPSVTSLQATWVKRSVSDSTGNWASSQQLVANGAAATIAEKDKDLMGDESDFGESTDQLGIGFNPTPLIGNSIASNSPPDVTNLVEGFRDELKKEHLAAFVPEGDAVPTQQYSTVPHGAKPRSASYTDRGGLTITSGGPQ